MTEKKTFPVTGLGCAACVARVENTLKNQKGVKNASVSLASNSAQVEYDASQVTPQQLQQAVAEAGYGLVVEEDGESDDEADRRQEAYRDQLKEEALFSAAFAVGIMLIEMGATAFRHGEWVMCALSALVVFGFGRRFFRSAWNQLRHGSMNMDTLVTLSITISFGYSLFNLITGRPELYFSSGAMIVTFILLGRYLEERAKHSTTAAIRGLMKLQEDDRTVQAGDRLTVRAGGRIPADGIVLEGSAPVDESMLTGESEPSLKTVGAEVYAGTHLLGGELLIEAKKVGQETLLSGIIRMVRDAQGSKAKIQQKVDRVAAVFVPVIIGVSLLTFVGWMVFSPESGIGRALMAMVTVLVIACPCSLGLATPTAIIAGIGRGASDGILIRDADALQLAGRTDAVVLDKTGTITEGVVGSDRVKPTSAEAVKTLRAQGIDVYMLSGDREEVVRRIAAEVGIDRYEAGVLPKDKHDFVKRLQAEGRTVAMCGDGINDSAALAAADVSVAMGGGSDIAIDSAMATIVSGDLRKVAQLVALSRKCSRIQNQNLFWAFFYNVCAVPVAAFGLLNPMVGAAAMALSSVCVVTNSLRLRKQTKI